MKFEKTLEIRRFPGAKLLLGMHKRMQKQIEQMPHSLTKNAQQKIVFKIFFSHWPALVAERFQGEHAHGIKEMAAQKN